MKKRGPNKLIILQIIAINSGKNTKTNYMKPLEIKKEAVWKEANIGPSGKQKLVPIFHMVFPLGQLKPQWKAHHLSNQSNQEKKSREPRATRE